MKKQPKPKNPAPVTVEELTALIVSVVETLEKKKADDEKKRLAEAEKGCYPGSNLPRYQFHATPHCDGCRCFEKPQNNWASPCNCGEYPRNYVGPWTCPAHGRIDRMITCATT